MTVLAAPSTDWIVSTLLVRIFWALYGEPEEATRMVSPLDAALTAAPMVAWSAGTWIVAAPLGTVKVRMVMSAITEAWIFADELMISAGRGGGRGGGGGRT